MTGGLGIVRPLSTAPSKTTALVFDNKQLLRRRKSLSTTTAGEALCQDISDWRYTWCCFVLHWYGLLGVTDKSNLRLVFGSDLLEHHRHCGSNRPHVSLIATLNHEHHEFTLTNLGVLSQLQET